MFRLGIRLKKFHFKGCHALDVRRSLGLPEKTEITNAEITKHFDVDEKFARAYFGYDETHLYGEIPFNLLAPGDLTETYMAAVCIDDKMTVERAKELFIAAKLSGGK